MSPKRPGDASQVPTSTAIIQRAIPVRKVKCARLVLGQCTTVARAAIVQIGGEASAVIEESALSAENLAVIAIDAIRASNLGEEGVVSTLSAPSGQILA